MSDKNVKWLYDELPDLVNKGILTEDAAERLKKHYKEPTRPSGVTIALTVFSIIGSLLIGAGIILLLAHNWQDIPRYIRAILSILPLIVSQVMGFWMLLKRRTSAAWREGVAIFNVCAVAASIALIGQTYNIPGDLQQFLLIWMLLILPMSYIFRATLPAFVYMIGITFWAGYSSDNTAGQTIWFVPLFAAVLPMWILKMREDIGSAASAALGWAACICLPVGIAFTVGENIFESNWLLLTASFLGIYYLAGTRWLKGKVPVWANPYRLLGGGGIAVVAWLLTFEVIWDEPFARNWLTKFSIFSESFPKGMFVLLFFVIAVVLLYLELRKKGRAVCVYGALPVAILVGHILAAATRDPWPSVVFFNFYVIGMSLSTIIVGIRNRRLGIVNGGMILLTALIAARFFDVEMSFLGRGIVFIVIGAGFLFANMLLAKKMKGDEQ